MTYYRAVRLYSALEATLFSALLVVWIGGFGKQPQFILGMTHGVGWIALCALVFTGALRGVFPWPLLAATVSPLGPIGCTIGFEVLSHRRRPPPAARHAVAADRGAPAGEH